MNTIQLNSKDPNFEKKLLSDFKNNPTETEKLIEYMNKINIVSSSNFFNHKLLILKPTDYFPANKEQKNYLLKKLEESPEEVIYLADIFDDVLENGDPIRSSSLTTCLLNTPLERIKRIWDRHFKNHPEQLLELLEIPSRKDNSFNEVASKEMNLSLSQLREEFLIK